MEQIEKILNVKKIKFDIMNSLFKPFKDCLVEEGIVNIFIDIPSTIKQLYNPQNITALSTNLGKDKYCIAACILNMVSHYRHYFASRWHNYTNIYFMYNSSTDKLITTQYDINYKKTYYEKRINPTNEIFGPMNVVIKDNFRIISIISKYLPHVAFIDTRDIDYRVLPSYYFKRQNEHDVPLNIILTTDHIFYQEVCRDNVMILEPRGDESRIVFYNNVMKIIGGDNKTFKTHPEYLFINPENISLLDAMVNQKDYDIEGIKKMGYTKAIQFLNKNNIDINEVISNKSSIESIFKDILTIDEIKTIQKNLCIFSNQYLMEQTENKLDIITEKANEFIFEPNELKKVNNKYFQRYPLLLDYMFEAEDCED